MVIRINCSEMPSFKVKIKSSLWLLIFYLLITHWLLVTIKHSQALSINKSRHLHRMKLIERAHSSKLLE